ISLLFCPHHEIFGLDLPLLRVIAAGTSGAGVGSLSFHSSGKTGSVIRRRSRGVKLSSPEQFAAVGVDTHYLLQEAMFSVEGKTSLSGSCMGKLQIQTLAEAQERIFPEDIGMSGFHVRKHHTGGDVLAVFFDSP